MGRHFLDVADAATLQTRPYLLTARAVREAITAQAMIAIHGEAGLGKTFAVEDAVGQADATVTWVSFPSGPTPRLVVATLLEQLTGRSSRLNRFEITGKLVELLSTGPRLIVIDESQLLTSECIELLRYLHDHRRTGFALLLVGGNGTWRVLAREPMLASRIYQRVRFEPLTRDEVLQAIPAYHAIFARTDPELVATIDRTFAHGSLRNWASFTHSALALLAETGRDRLDEQITRNVFALHTGGTH